MNGHRALSETRLRANRAMLHLIAAAHTPVPEPLAHAMMDLVARCAAEVDAEQRGTAIPGWAGRLRAAVMWPAPETTPGTRPTGGPDPKRTRPIRWFHGLQRGVGARAARSIAPVPDSTGDFEARLTSLEGEVAQLRERVALTSSDAAAARVLAAGADRDVSEVRAEL